MTTSVVLHLPLWDRYISRPALEWDQHTFKGNAGYYDPILGNFLFRVIYSPHYPWHYKPFWYYINAEGFNLHRLDKRQLSQLVLFLFDYRDVSPNFGTHKTYTTED